MEKLSDEILVRIFSFLSARDLCRCSQVRTLRICLIFSRYFDETVLRTFAPKIFLRTDFF